MKLLTLLTLLTVVILVGCQAQLSTQEVPQEHFMNNLPCHQMPDGSWMGNCNQQLSSQDVSESLALAKPSSIVELGSEYEITADIVEFSIEGVSMVGNGYNQEIPGPLLRAEKNQRTAVRFTNNLDEPTTIHWHGLRHNIKDDGVPGVSQAMVEPGESYTYNLFFPDEGLFWYHPHVREDRQQDKGLAGLIRVGESQYEEEYIVLDDLFVQQEMNFNYGEEHANFALMGRYGNKLLINGESSFSTTMKTGEIKRFFFTNVANARPFRIHFEDANVKAVGGDIGDYAQQAEVDHVIIAPAERVAVDVQYLEVGTYNVIHESADELEYIIGTIEVMQGDSVEDFSIQINQEVQDEVESFRQYFNKEIDYTLTLNVENTMMANMPCHEMAGVWMGDCDFEELESQGLLEKDEDDPRHEGGIEWEDEMQMMNLMSTSENTKWQLIDQDGNINMDIDMNAKVGDVLRIRINNTLKSAHPMQHPIHLHGQRFLVSNIDGEELETMGWEDTVLVPVGSVADIIVDVTNPGEWMIHCHIAEHLEAGMMASFIVEE